MIDTTMRGTMGEGSSGVICWGSVLSTTVAKLFGMIVRMLLSA